MRAAVTGGAGFVGRVLIRRLLDSGADVAALARNPKKITPKDNLLVVEGDLENQPAINRVAGGADIFIHLAGVTHARRDADYYTVNVDGAAAAAKAASKAGARFIHISSMSARLPGVSPYADSKFQSERAIAAASGANPWLALRLPAIYGPGDLVTLPYFKLVKSGLALEPKTARPARASILFVEDAAAAIIAAAADAPPGSVYEVGDGRAEGHAWSEIGKTLGDVLDKRTWAIRVPRPVIAAYHGVLRGSANILGRSSSVRTGQINEFFHPDWVARNNLLGHATGWRPAATLKEGFAKTARWYQENGLL